MLLLLEECKLPVTNHSREQCTSSPMLSTLSCPCWRWAAYCLWFWRLPVCEVCFLINEIYLSSGALWIFFAHWVSWYNQFKGAANRFTPRSGILKWISRWRQKQHCFSQSRKEGICMSIVRIYLGLLLASYNLQTCKNSSQTIRGPRGPGSEY